MQKIWAAVRKYWPYPVITALIACGTVAFAQASWTGPWYGVAFTGGQVSVTNPLPVAVESGGGGGGGGAVTIASGAVSAGAYSAGSFATGSGVDGWNLTEGTKADVAYSGSGSSSIVAALKGIYAALVAALPAGTNIIGKVGVDQTTPGTTNGVALVGVNSATALAGAGATGTGSLRVTAAQDTTTIAGSAPGTAGTPSVNVVSMQGVASGTPVPVSASSGALAAGAGTDGWNVTEGAKADAAYAGSGSASIVAALKGIYAALVAATPAGSNIIGKVGIDQTTPGTTNGVVINSGNTGGFDSGPVQATGAVNASSHAAGTSLGGLITLAVARTSGGSGGISQIVYKSGKGSTGQVVLRIWAHNPTNTTCTDNTAFVGSTTDDAYLITPPFALTPAALAVTTGDALTYAALLPGRLSFVTSGNTNLYACVLTVTTDTADESGSVYVQLGGDLN